MLQFSSQFEYCPDLDNLFQTRKLLSTTQEALEPQKNSNTVATLLPTPSTTTKKKLFNKNGKNN
jgi:hypothetical protein